MRIIITLFALLLFVPTAFADFGWKEPTHNVPPPTHLDNSDIYAMLEFMKPSTPDYYQQQKISQPKIRVQDEYKNYPPKYDDGIRGGTIPANDW